jgi:NAD-reducing hydrogenase large subunit
MTKKIVIEPVTRVEGHGKVTVHLNDKGHVDKAHLHITQVRGFEKFCEGRLFNEMPAITPRICGICPVSHHLASAKAGDEVLGAPPPRPANLLRELMHMGQIVQSHGMHFFELAGPDLLLGFDADPAIRNVVGLLQANPDLTVKAVMLRKWGQEIIRILGGRRIHPNFAIPGGVNKALTKAERDEILAGYEDALATTQAAIGIMQGWAEANSDIINEFAVFPTGYFGLVKPGNTLELYEGNIRLTGADGKELEKFDPRNYLNYIAEHVENWSYLKFPYYKKMGYPQGVYRVGPLGRCNTSDKMATPLADEELKKWKKINNGKPVENTLHYHTARLIETLYAIENVKVLLDDPDILSNDILNTCRDPKPYGVGVIEAPRGTLIHHYWMNENQQIEKVNLIVSTGHNNWAMSEAVDSVAKTYITNAADVTEGQLNRVEAAIRAHDPCLSCSTHAVGQMPIIMEIRDSSDQLVKTITRD